MIQQKVSVLLWHGVLVLLTALPDLEQAPCCWGGPAAVAAAVPMLQFA
jgi:hypothetical protein